ncbi:MAG TPA: cell cycle transcriptional regulator TrcR [Alphaproteobacteria bacterium]|nr:cell cycle transcriptional regulator TrcR [Alphaproteobacteria bacterium]
MALPLMPKATAVWLVENTSLTFEQIADFCGLHALEVQGIADGEVAVGIVGLDPVASGQLMRPEIERCESDPTARLKLIETSLPLPSAQPKGARYTPVSKRHDRPSAIAWLLRHHPELSDAQVGRLVGTTKATIQKVRDRTHWDMANIKPTNPVGLGLCTQEALDDALDKAHRAAERAKRETERAARRAAKALAEAQAAKAADAARKAAEEQAAKEAAEKMANAADDATAEPTAEAASVDDQKTE